MISRTGAPPSIHCPACDRARVYAKRLDLWRCPTCDTTAEQRRARNRAIDAAWERHIGRPAHEIIGRGAMPAVSVAGRAWQDARRARYRPEEDVT